MKVRMVMCSKCEYDSGKLDCQDCYVCDNGSNFKEKILPFDLSLPRNIIAVEPELDRDCIQFSEGETEYILPECLYFCLYMNLNKMVCKKYYDCPDRKKAIKKIDERMKENHGIDFSYWKLSRLGFPWGYFCSNCENVVFVDYPHELPKECPECSREMMGYIGSRS